jgi:hypothetical protein
LYALIVTIFYNAVVTSPEAHVLIQQGKIHKCNKFLTKVKEDDPLLICEILKTILSEMKTSPVVNQVARAFQSEIMSYLKIMQL